MRALVPVLLVACSGSSPEDDTGENEDLPQAPSYAERGPWGVGTARVDITGTDDLRIPVQIWYPTQTTGEPTVVYDSLLEGNAQ